LLIAFGYFKNFNNQWPKIAEIQIYKVWLSKIGNSNLFVSWLFCIKNKKMFNIIPLILILICLILIINIVIKKFSALASLDVASIPAEREARFKERIMGNRLKKNYFKYYSKLQKIIRPIGEALGNFFKMLYRRLVEFKDSYNRGESIVMDQESHIRKLSAEAAENFKNNDFDEAEKKYIEIISLDSKNIDAFRSLGQLYLNQKKYQEAEQTLAHVLKLLEKQINQPAGTLPDEVNLQLAETYFNLAELGIGKSSLVEASAHIVEALQVIPNNPRYLDMKLEISIINKDKKTAEEAWEKLTEVNPENQKLEDFKKKISEI
jgi:tetratricopeptide (TPR) repeat protein